MNLVVNGKPIEINPLPGETLADLLRKRLGLTGTKVGCGEAECGACTVLVDGEAVVSCTYPAARAAGKEILTIEGLELGFTDPSPAQETREGDLGSNLHPLQQAFILHGAIQCGFCTPGQIVTAYGLLMKNQNPTKEEIREALKDTLCRCAGYSSIENAILAAAAAMRTGEKISLSQVPSSSKPLGKIGNAAIRPDAVDKATGNAKFTDDLSFENMLFGKVKRAGVPHAIVKQIGIDKVCALPGVHAVLTAADIPGAHTHGILINDWPSLVGVGERVRYVGDAVALVAAESESIAEQALSLIELELEALEVVDSPIRAYDVDAQMLHDGGNLLEKIEVLKGNPEQGFADSDIVLERTFSTQTMDHVFLEPECSIARPTEDGRMEVYVGSQIPYNDRHQIARALNWPEEKVRVVGQLMGGGFGGKEDIAGQIHAALLAYVTNRPVKVLYDRHESLIAHPKRHATQIRVKLGAKNDGSLMAIETELYGDTGAYASLGHKVMARALTHSSGAYDVPNVQGTCFAMYTNNPPAGAFRGFGALQGQFAIENIIDQLAETINVDPIEIRRMNALRIGSMTNTGQLLRESVGLEECINKVEEGLRRICAQEGIENPFEPYNPDRNLNLVRSWGFAIAYKNTGLGGGAPDTAGAEVELYSDGTLEVRTASAELGQGLVTVLKLIVAEIFSQREDQVRVLVMDTDLTPDGGPTTASRQTYVTGNAALHAARSLRKIIISALAEKFNQHPDSICFAPGMVGINGEQIPLGEVVTILREEEREPRVMYEYHAPETKPLGEGGDMHFAFSFAAQAVEIEVNKQTGEVAVLRVVAANDVGKALNPLGLQGQIEGGVNMGVGHALTENFIVENGIPITDHLARYRMLNITQSPEIISYVVEHPTGDGPFGAKGVGEIVSIPTIPAITNAIYNAVGVRIQSLPVDQEFILKNL